MKMKKSSITVERYEVGDWYVDVVSRNKLREAWLSHKDYGVSKLMFGIPVREAGRPAMFYNQFLDIVMANIEKYISDYESEVF